MKTLYSILSRNFVILICSFVLLFFLLQIIFIKDHTFYNPDEFEWLYCSQRLMENDFKLSSFDSHTTGPFSIYILSFYFKITNNFSIENLHIFKELIKLLTISLFVVYNLKDKWKLIISVLITLMLLSIPNPDILSFNTEFLSLPIIVYLYFNKNKPILFVESLLIFALPLIKLQFAIFAVLFGINQLYRIYFQHDIFIKYTKLFFLYVSFALFFYFTVFINYFDVFIFNYFEKNIWHMAHFSNKTHFQAVLYYVKHPMSILFFLLLTGTILFFFSLNKVKHVFISFSFLFLASSFFAIYIPKNAFTHYFVLAVVPISIFVSNLVTLDQESFKKKLIYLFTIILFITYGQLESRNSRYIFSVCPPVEKNKTYANAPITKIEPTLDSLILDSPQKKPKIFISGWFTAQYYYYKYHNFIKPVYRSSYTFYLNKFSGDIYEKDLLQFWEDIEKPELPDIIVKLPEFPFVSQKFDLLLANKYILFESKENNHIYVLKK